MKEAIEFIKPFLTESNMWLAISVLGTIALVQGFKAVLKHYTQPMIDSSPPKLSKFTRKFFLFLGAFAIGYATVYNLVDKPDVGKWAFSIGVLNPFMYMGFLIYAERKGWTRVVAALKMRRVIVVKNEETGEEELEVEKTIMFTGDMNSYK